MRKHSFKHNNSNSNGNGSSQAGSSNFNSNVVSAPDFFKEDEIPQKM